MKSILPSLGFIAAISLLTSGCQTLSRPSVSNQAITHVVVCWLKKPGDQNDIRALREASKSLEVIPGVQSVDFGTALPSHRPVVDDSFDAAVVIRFENQQALAAYAENPIHQRAVKDVLAPRVKRLVIYDVKH
jgi:antibiotic biosynthesis monooxygenase (ABM) superfamily enzyme